MEGRISPISERVCSGYLNKKGPGIASARINFLKRGLQEESLVKDTDVRVLHSTRSATREFTIADKEDSIVNKLRVLCYCSETSESVIRESRNDASVFQFRVHAVDVINYGHGHHGDRPSSPTSVLSEDENESSIFSADNHISQQSEDGDEMNSEFDGDISSPVFACTRDQDGASLTCSDCSFQIAGEFDDNPQDSGNGEMLSDSLRLSVSNTLNNVMSAFMDDASVDEEMNVHCDHACGVLDHAELVPSNFYDENPCQDAVAHMSMPYQDALCLKESQEIVPDASDPELEMSPSTQCNLTGSSDVSPHLRIEDQSIVISEPLASHDNSIDNSVTHESSEDVNHSEPLLFLSSKDEVLSTLRIALQVKHDCYIDDPDAPSTPDFQSECKLWNYDETSSPEEESHHSEPQIESPLSDELLSEHNEEEHPVSLNMQHLCVCPEYNYGNCSRASELQDESSSLNEVLGKQNEEKDYHISEDGSHASQPQDISTCPGDNLASLPGKHNEENDDLEPPPIENSFAASEYILEIGWEMKCNTDACLLSRTRVAKKMLYLLKVLAWKTRASSAKSPVRSRSHSLVMRRLLRTRNQKKSALDPAWFLLMPFLTTMKAGVSVDHRVAINLLILSYRNTKKMNGMEEAAEDHLSISFGTVRKCTVPVMQLCGQNRKNVPPAKPIQKSKDGSSQNNSQSPARSLKRKEDWSDMQENPRPVKRNEDWNNIPIDQTQECLDTCLVRLQPAPVTFPSDRVDCIRSSSLSSVEDPYAKIQFEVSKTISAQPSSSSCSVIEKQSKQKLRHFAEVFLLRRHITQQQRRAQQYPPFPPQDTQDCQSSTSRLSDGCLSMDSQLIDLERGDYDMSLSSRGTSPEFTVDVCELQKLVDVETSQLGSYASVMKHNTPSEPDIPNLVTIIVTIVTVIIYTKILCRNALSRVGIVRTDERLQGPEP